MPTEWEGGGNNMNNNATPPQEPWFEHQNVWLIIICLCNLLTMALSIAKMIMR